MGSVAAEITEPTIGWDPTLLTPRKQHIDIAIALVGALLAAALVGVVLPPVWVRAETMAVARVFSFITVLPLAARRRYPVVSGLAIALLAIVTVLAGFPWLLPADVAILVALYSVTRYGPGWAVPAALAGALVGAIVLPLGIKQFQAEANLSSLITIGALIGSLLLATWAIALVRRTHQQTIWALRSRAEALDDRAVMLELRARKAEIERDQQAQIAATNERIRIAREMHDIVGHALTGMVFVANSGAYAAEATGDATAAARALNTVSKTGTEALSTMRQLLRVLRDDAGQWREAEVGAPTPGTISSTQDAADPYGWHRLIADNQQLGMDLTVTETGTPATLEPAVANALYRITQESLTNIRKHAGPQAQVQINLAWQVTGGFRLTITDDGGGSTGGQTKSDGSGQGLIGMQERAALAGGTLTAGPTPNGWQVEFAVK